MPSQPSLGTVFKYGRLGNLTASCVGRVDSDSFVPNPAFVISQTRPLLPLYSMLCYYSGSTPSRGRGSV
jgi:hypothetical protein